MHTIVLQSMEGMYNRGLEHDCNGLYPIVLDCSMIGPKTIGSQSVLIVSIVPQSKISYNSKQTRLEHDCLIVRIQKLPYIPFAKYCKFLGCRCTQKRAIKHFCSRYKFLQKLSSLSFLLSEFPSVQFGMGQPQFGRDFSLGPSLKSD